MKILQMIEMESDGAGRKFLFPSSYPSSVSTLSVFLLPFILMMKGGLNHLLYCVGHIYLMRQGCSDSRPEVLPNNPSLLVSFSFSLGSHVIW